MKTYFPLLLIFSLTGSIYGQLNALYSDDKVELKWSKPHNAEIDYFVVERSKTGKCFKKLLKVDAPKDDIDYMEYYEVDNKPYKKQTHYRIKQVDKSGMRRYSNVIVTEKNKPQELSEVFGQSRKSNSIRDFLLEEVLVVLVDQKNNEFVAKVNISEERGQLVIQDTNIELPNGNYRVAATSDDMIQGRSVVVESLSNPVYTQNRE